MSKCECFIVSTLASFFLSPSLPSPDWLVTVRSQSAGTWSVIGVSAAAAYSAAPNDALGRENSASYQHLSAVISVIFPLRRQQPPWDGHLKKKLKIYKNNHSIVSLCTYLFTSHLHLKLSHVVSPSAQLCFIKVGQGLFRSQQSLLSFRHRP